MEDRRAEVIELLAGLKRSGDTFVGPTVHDDVTRCRYPVAWIDTLRRYADLVKLSPPSSLYIRFYLDLCTTVLTEKIVNIDIHRIVGADDPVQDAVASDTRIAHAIVFKMTVSRVIACVCECVLKTRPLNDNGGVTDSEAARLYTRLETMLTERFYKNPADGKYYAREKFDITAAVHELVDGWLLQGVFPNALRRANTDLGPFGFLTAPDGTALKTRLLSSDPSFFGVSHVYWLWLHLTAAGLRTMKTENDFLALFYAFDLFVFCPQCSSHFLRHRSAFYTRDPYAVSVRTLYSASEAVHGMHNVVNRETGKGILPPTVLSDYTGYWQRHALLAAEE